MLKTKNLLHDTCFLRNISYHMEFTKATNSGFVFNWSILHSYNWRSQISYLVATTSQIYRTNKLKVCFRCLQHQSYMKLAKDLAYHAHSKHIKMHYHYIHEKLLEGDIKLSHVASNHLLPKLLSKLKFKNLDGKWEDASLQVERCKRSCQNTSKLILIYRMWQGVLKLTHS